MSSTSRTRENPRDLDRRALDRQATDERPNERGGAAKAARKEPARDEDTDEFYDEVVKGGPAEGEAGEDDVYQRLTRVNVRDIEEALVEDLDPANLAAALEGAPAEGPDGEAIVPSALDEDVLEQDTEMERALLSEVVGEEDDGGSVAPEELGEQFLRGAAQQERRVARNDAESPADVDLLSDSVHQVSLFDHNQDPLAEPHLPEVVADETEADAAHRPVERSASKRAARYAAEDRSAALGANKRKASNGAKGASATSSRPKG